MSQAKPERKITADSNQRLQAFEQNVAECTIAMPLCLSPAQTGTTSSPPRSLTGAFESFYMDVFRSTARPGYTPQTLMGMAGKGMNLESFTALNEVVASKKSALERENVSQDEVDRQMDEWFSGLLEGKENIQENESANAAIRELQTNFGGADGAKNFLWGAGQQFVNQYYGFFNEYIGKPNNAKGEQQLRIAPLENVVNFKPAEKGAPLRVSCVAKNFEVYAQDEDRARIVGSDRSKFASDAYFRVDQELTKISEVEPGKKQGEFKVSAYTNNQKLAEDYFVDYCDRQLKKLEAKDPALKILRAQREEKATASLSKPPAAPSWVTKIFGGRELAAAHEAKKAEAKALAAIDSNDRFLWESIYTNQKNMPASKDFRETLADMAERVPPRESAIEVVTPANVYLATAAAEAGARNYLAQSSRILPLLSGEDKAVVTARMEAANIYLNHSGNTKNYADVSRDALTGKLQEARMVSEKFAKYGQDSSDMLMNVAPESHRPS